MLLPERKLLLLCAKVTLIAVVVCDVSQIHNDHYDQRHLANQQQSPTGHEHHYHGQDGKYDALNDGTGWDIRLSVPGEPDRDYPTLNSVPRTAFSCSGKNPGYYADTQTRCQVFRVCANTAPTGFFSFLCPNGTLFNQEVLVCDWWMNVRCVDSERFVGVNQALTMKSGVAMMANIKKMIMYPMMNPYTAILPQMRQTYQTYNPPEGMFAEVQRPINNNFQASELTGSLKLAMPFSSKKIDANRDSYSSGSAIGSTLQYQGVVPANHNPVYKESTSSSFFTRENFGGLSLQNSFNSSINQGVKVTKQQFTYPSQYDKQYTVSVPKAPTSPPLVVHFPINVPAIDNNNGTAETKLSKPLPLIVLLLQPPLEHSKFEKKSKTSSDLSSSSLPSSSSASSFNESSTGFIKGSSNTVYTHPNHNYGNSHHNLDKMSSNSSQFTANVASQTNYYITNNVVPNKNKFIPTDVENIPYKPTRLVADSNVQESASKINITSFMNSLTNSSQIIDNSIDVDKNNLVTLFSAHLIPSGDVEKQRVLKICIPKDMLSFLLHLHNSTRAALEMSYQNSAQTNKTILFQGVPFIRKFMENMLMKNSNSDLQVPIATAEALYESQKTINENYQKKQSEFNNNFESQYFASQNTRNNEGKISSTQFTHFEPQQSVQKQESISKNQNFQSQYQSSDVKSYDSKTSNVYKSNLNEKINTNYQIASTPSTFNNPPDYNVQSPENHSGGSFYSVQQSIYQNRKGSPNQIENRQEIAKAENGTQGGSFVTTESISGNPSQFEDYYNYGKFTNQNKSVNYSLQQNFQATKRIQTTVQTTVANSGYAESKGAFQSTKSDNGNTHNEGRLISVQQHSPLQNSQKPMPFTVSTPAGASFQKEINYSSFHTAHSTPDNKQQQLKFEQFSQSVNKSPQRNPEANVYRTNYIASSESTPPQQYSYSVTQQRTPTEQTAIKTHIYPNQIQADTSSIMYTSSGSSQNNDQSNQYSQYVNVPVKQNANLQFSSQQHNQNLIQNNNAPNYSPYPNQQIYSVPTQYPTQTQHEVQSNQKYEINAEKQHVGDYTTVEVVPALGFAIDSIRERQDYYNALAKGLQSVQNEYLPPYTQQRVLYATNDKSYSNSQDDKYQTMYNENYRQNENAQYSRYNSQYGGQDRLVQGQIIAHPQSEANGQSQPLEDFGYSQQKPSVPFTY